MLVKKTSLWYRMVQDKSAMSDPSSPNHTTITYLGDLIHTIWVFGLYPFGALLIVFFLLKDNLNLSEEKMTMIGVSSIVCYVLLLFISMALLAIIEPFTRKKWRKLILV